jgi:flavorubredoxin
MATITEVAEDIYRINVEFGGSPVTYSFFLIKDELPAMVETGFSRTFNETEEALKQLIDPSKLRYIVVPHFEADECGALNHFLGLAPNAQPVGSPIGARSNLADFAIRQPVALADGEVLDLGKHRLECLLTPYVHTWDSMLPFDQTTRTQFCSDVFIQPGPGPATTAQAEIEGMVEMYKNIGIFPSRAHLDSALNKIEARSPQVLACHHGSVITGQIPAYIKAMRERDVIGVTDSNPMQEANY